MSNDRDHYEEFYAKKLWNLLPATYRTLDTDQFDVAGPLRELVNRIGAQAAILRRGIDRLWEDQSIESCDDWVIPYIGELLATSLVSNIDARTMRRDVAKTIYYRRRKGTLGVLEEIALDFTGWNARVVEFSRRLARTRHGLDLTLGRPSISEPDIGRLQQDEGLRGPLTQTSIGGLADLRKVSGALKVGSAFDEFSHAADPRKGQGTTGWYGIPRLGIFLWRLQSFGVGPTSPVESSRCPGEFTFDPTGREIPLFAAARPGQSGEWTSPAEWQLPTPLTRTLLEPAVGAQPAYPLYAVDDDGSLNLNSLGLFVAGTGSSNDALIPASLLTVDRLNPVSSAFSAPPSSAPTYFIDPARGRFIRLPHTAKANLRVTYHYGFSSTIGAGPYDRRLGSVSLSMPDPQLAPLTGGGQALIGLGAIPKSGTVTINDSLSYTALNDVVIAGSLTLRAGPGQRPVVRLAQSTPVTFRGGTGSAANGLVLDGLYFSGTDVVLSGEFESVTVNCCTLDPGNRAPQSPGRDHSSPAVPFFAQSVDGRDLVPCRLWVEGQIGTLTIARCLCGPIRTRNGGRIKTLFIRDTIVQAIPTSGTGLLQPRDVKDPLGFEAQLGAATNPVGSSLRARSPTLRALLNAPGGASIPFSAPILQALIDSLNELLAGPSLFDAKVFQNVLPSPATRRMLQGIGSNHSAPMTELNRRLLEDAFPRELADAALALSDGDANLLRSTILGRVAVHRLQASDCILRDLAQADDTQHGCVRFTAWADGSVLPRQYESPRIPEGARLFVSTDFGQPGYGQLLPTADTAVSLPPGAAPALPQTILAGAENGSEMGAFARELNPIKEAGLLLKYEEYMPVGLLPVLIHVT